jgi:hypothetical protein
MNKKDVRRGRSKRQNKLLIPALFVLGGASLLGLAAFALFGGGREEFVPEVVGAAALRVDKEEVNLGDVPLGQWVRVSFELANVGDQQLRFATAPYVEVVEGC